MREQLVTAELESMYSHIYIYIVLEGEFSRHFLESGELEWEKQFRSFVHVSFT